MIRQLSTQDFDAVMGLLSAMHQEIGMAEISPERTARVVARLLQGGSVFGVERDGALVGSIGLMSDRFWYSEKWFVGDYWTYVVPDERGGGAGEMLVSAALELAAKRKQPLLLGTVGLNRTEAKERWYRKQGLEPAGALFWRGNGHG